MSCVNHNFFLYSEIVFSIQYASKNMTFINFPCFYSQRDLNRYNWDAVIADEAHKIKVNIRGLTFKSLPRRFYWIFLGKNSDLDHCPKAKGFTFSTIF